jgi:malonate-semialdehyde dehydrogenase (acetylating)/methylmalonate-semialdehyde dehydrogenase
VVVPVGEKTANILREKLIPRSRAARRRLDRCGGALRPVVTEAHKERIESYIQMCADEGGELVVDGAASSCRGMRRASSSARPSSTM